MRRHESQQLRDSDQIILIAIQRVVMAMILALMPTYLLASPQPQAGATYKTSKTDQRGTDSDPVVIKVVPVPDAEKHAARQEEIENHKAKREERLINATISLAAITAFLAAFT